MGGTTNTWKAANRGVKPFNMKDSKWINAKVGIFLSFSLFSIAKSIRKASHLAGVLLDRD
jgi:hypothetical protein